MKLGLIALLAFGCRSHQPAHHDDAGSGSARPASVVSVLPKLPQSPSGVEELAVLDATIAQHRDDPRYSAIVIADLRARATYRGHLEDYLDALALSRQWIEGAPDAPAAWRTRADTLIAVHDFTGARQLLDHLTPVDKAHVLVALDEATGHLETALAYHAKHARETNRPEDLVHYGALLGAAGRLDDGLAAMKQAAAAVRDNPPQLFATMLFQWGRLYELKGEPATARQFYEASRARMVTLEATVHLIQAMIATGDSAKALELATAEAATDPHPELLALAGKTAEAKAAWARYLAALPDAFADHAARFDLGPGADPAAALTLARANHANRDTREARELVVEAALAAGDPKTACEVAPALAADVVRTSRFLAWRAFTSCHADADAARLATELGIR